MQTTLLGLAIAIILALVTALVGPLLIDWGSHRTWFEAEASRLIGVDVRVTGAIDAQLLPSPQFTLHRIEVGSGTEKIRASSLGIEFALGQLMRGQWRASQLHLIGPQATLGLDASGQVRAPALAVAFDPEDLAIDRLSIEDGRLTLADASSGARVALERLSFAGDARSLLGPFKGEGAVSIGGAEYSYRIAAGRYGDDGTLKLRLSVDPINRPFSIEADGIVTLAGGRPKFDGGLSLTRAAGIAARGVAQQTIRQPWRASGKIKATAQSALMEQVDFQYGSEERGLNLTGVADFTFGKAPRFTGVLSGRQIDLDRTLAAGAANRRLPGAVIRELAELGGGGFRPSIPIQIGVGIDQITLGGGTVQNLRGDISSDATGWNLDRFEFRAPGFTQVRLSGHLAADGDGVGFTGPAEVDAGDPQALAAWLSGAGDSGQGDLRPLNLRGDVTFSSEKIAVERLSAEFDRKPLTGRFVYVFAAAKKSAKLDAALNAPEVDLDAALGFGNALLAGSAIERPHDLTIAVHIGRATWAGFVARNTSVRLKVDGSGLQVDRLAVGDIGGVAFSVSGRFATAASAPHGSMSLDLSASDMTPVIALLARFAPDTAQAVGSVATTMAPADLRARLSIDGAAQATQAKLAIDGSLGKVRVALNGQASADPIAVSLGDIRIDGRLEADDGKAVVAMIGLDRLVAATTGAGALSLKASGPVRGDLKVDGRLTAGSLEANIAGSTRLWADAPAAALRVTVVKADMAPLRAASAGRAALPVALTTHMTLAGNELSIADINGTVAGSIMRGRLDYGLASPHRVRGEIEADLIDGAGVIAAAIGTPTQLANNSHATVSWSNEPFAAGVFGDFTGQIALRARQLDLLPWLAVQDFRTTLHLGANHFAFEDLTGNVAGGTLTGQASFNASDRGVKLHAKMSMVGTDAARVVPGPARPPVSGSLDLACEVEGVGLSPVALIGSLQGAGKISLVDAQFAGLNPRAFEAVTQAVDQGLPVDAGRITSVAGKALDIGSLSVKRVVGTISINAGQVRLSKVTADAKDATLTLGGNLDLADGSIDARMVLSGTRQAAGARPDIFITLKGPVTSPSRNIDVTALTAWLTLRAVDIQAKQLREIENAPRPKTDRPSPPKNEPAGEQAPALPAPIEIRPTPVPMRSGRPASVGPQN